MSIPALKNHEYDWPDTPREDVYQARSEYKNKLLENGLPVEELADFMAEWDLEHGI